MHRIRFLTNILLFVLSLYAAVYGVTYAYLLHHIVNIICAWLLVIHLSIRGVSLFTIDRYFGSKVVSGVISGGVGAKMESSRHLKKRP